MEAGVSTWVTPYRSAALCVSRSRAPERGGSTGEAGRARRPDSAGRLVHAVRSRRRPGTPGTAGAAATGPVGPDARHPDGARLPGHADLPGTRGGPPPLVGLPGTGRHRCRVAARTHPRTAAGRAAGDPGRMPRAGRGLPRAVAAGPGRRGAGPTDLRS